MSALSGDLFGERVTTQIERLFLGLMLPSEAAAAATRVLADARGQYGLKGSAIRPDRLHVTLIHVGDYAGSLPQSVITNIRTAAEGLSETVFDVTFDRAASFAGAPGKHPCVLLGGDGLEALRALRDRLFRALLRVGVRTLSREAFTPHVTLAYGDRQLPEWTVDPVSWRPAEVLLLHSEVGRSTYHALGRWPLRD